MSSSGDSDRPQYARKLELMLSLVGYAVGLGNIWRFPYLTFASGGGAFLIPYFLSMLLLGLPLFSLELGLGQMLRKGALGIWLELGLPRLRGIGAAAAACTFLVSLYYNVILSWAIYYLGRCIYSMFSTRVLPWSDQAPGFACPGSILFPSDEIAGLSDVVDPATGLYNPTYKLAFWCPETGIPDVAMPTPPGHTRVLSSPSFCPSWAAVDFWQNEVLQRAIRKT